MQRKVATIPVAERWFEARKVADDITLIREPEVVPFLRCNIWHVRGRDRDLLIDTGLGVASLREFTRDFIDKPVAAVATHAHVDHVGGHHEFDECIVHPKEAAGLTAPSRVSSLAGEGFDPADLATLAVPQTAGYDMAGPMLTALPRAGYDVQTWRLRPARVTRLVDDGDMIDLGDRVFEVLHLPGHSPGSIGLLERATGTLFAGDAIYDGPLVDGLHHSDIAEYRETMARLRSLPVTTIHAGHDPSFGRERLTELIDGQLARWDAQL